MIAAIAHIVSEIFFFKTGVWLPWFTYMHKNIKKLDKFTYSGEANQVRHSQQHEITRRRRTTIVSVAIQCCCFFARVIYSMAKKLGRWYSKCVRHIESSLTRLPVTNNNTNNNLLYTRKILQWRKPILYGHMVWRYGTRWWYFKAGTAMVKR